MLPMSILSVLFVDSISVDRFAGSHLRRLYISIIIAIAAFSFSTVVWNSSVWHVCRRTLARLEAD